MRIAKSASIFGAALSGRFVQCPASATSATPGHGAGHLVREFRHELLGGNALVLQSAMISPNIHQRFLRRRDRVDQMWASS
jgi:hypothetical protein